MAVRPFLQFGLFLVFSFWILTWGALATAGTLKMETQTTVEVAKDLLTANVTLTNRGTAPAYNLQVHLNTLKVGSQGSTCVSRFLSFNSRHPLNCSI